MKISHDIKNKMRKNNKHKMRLNTQRVQSKHKGEKKN